MARRGSDSSMSGPSRSHDVFRLCGRAKMPYNVAVTVGTSNIPMNNILNQLIQLQELNFAKEEQKASNSKMPLAQLEKSIAAIRAQLPDSVAERYDRLQTRYPLAVVPLSNGSCSRCGLAVPHNVVNAAKAGEELQTCPHCGRFLFFPDTVARQPKKKFEGKRPVEVGIARFSAANLMVPRLAATTREGVI